jgi:redox-sensitive bicupin YhaK (pirin superfamily)
MEAITVLRKSNLGVEDRGWTRGHITCSFDDYPKHAPGYLVLGDLRLAVLQEIDPGAGYPLHPHEETETIMIPLSGAITHEDDLGSPPEVTGPSDVAVLSAGTGVRHAEMVHGDDKVRAVMFWLRSSPKGHAPRFARRNFAREDRANRLVTLASGRAGAPAGALEVRSDSEVRSAVLEPSAGVAHEIGDGRAAYLVTTDGAVEIGGARIEPGERVIARGPRTLAIRALEKTEVVLLDLPLPA